MPISNYSNKKHQLNLIIISLIILESIWLTRTYLADNTRYLFLTINLGLALIPWVITSLITINTHFFNKHRWFKYILLGFWLLFLPNSPYIITDFVHITHKPSLIPYWFDILMIFSFAWVGLMFGFYSLIDVIKMFRASKNKKYFPIVVSFILFLSAFGVYLGRVLRWNSWDIFNRPLHLFSQIVDRVIFPLEHLGTWSMTIFLGLLLNLIFWTVFFNKSEFSRQCMEN